MSHDTVDLPGVPGISRSDYQLCACLHSQNVAHKELCVPILTQGTDDWLVSSRLRSCWNAGFVVLSEGMGHLGEAHKDLDTCLIIAAKLVRFLQFMRAICS